MKSSTKSALLAIATVFLWSSAFPITKIAAQAFTPNALGLFRCTLAAGILLGIGCKNRFSKPKKPAHMLLFLLSGGLGFTLYMLFFNTGMLTLNSAVASLIIATTPVLTAAGASVLYHEKIRPAGWCAIAAAFGGVAILLLSDIAGSSTSGSGLLFMIGAAIVFCGYNLLNRKLLSMGYTAVETVTWSMVSGALLLMFFLPQTLPQIGQAAASCLPALMAAVYLGAMPSATAYLLWSRAFSLAEKTSDVTNYQFLTPLLSTAMGFAMLGEVPSLSTIAGGLVIIASLVIFSRKGR
ncbi:MAG: DMT family transporter [Anaerovoracaceae bacterium]|nr:DMT family transporter [Anaerovoracaceae bacterium]